MENLNMGNANATKIAYILNTYPKGSHTFIRREMLALEKLGCQIIRIAIRGKDEPVYDELDKLERKMTYYLLGNGALVLLKAMVRCFAKSPITSIKCMILAASFCARRTDRSSFRHIASFVEACCAAELILGSSCQHIHAHFGTNSAEVAMLVSKITGVPYSFTVHGPEEFDAPRFNLMKEKVSAAKFVIAISYYGQSQLYRWIDKNDRSKIKVVYCGIETNESPGDVAATNVLVCVGRLAAQKGHFILLQAISIALKTYPNIKLKIIGDGELRRDLENEVLHLGISDNVEFVGWLDDSGVVKSLKSARALVLSSFAEGLPIVLMESMANFRPVITTSVAGNFELVKPEVNGWLCVAGDPVSLAQSIVSCMAASDQTLHEMGQAAHEMIKFQHDADTQGRVLLRIFEKKILSS